MTEQPKHRLQKARANAGFQSPAEAARAFRDINQNTLTSHENGTRAISRKAAEIYAKNFGVRAGWLLFGEGNTETSLEDELIEVFPKLSKKSRESLLEMARRLQELESAASD